MKMLVPILAMTLVSSAFAAEPSYVTVVKYPDGRFFQAWGALPEAECKAHLPKIDKRNLHDAQHIASVTCEKADTLVMQHTKVGNTTTKEAYGKGPTTAAICKQWVEGPLKADKSTPGATYSCEKVKAAK